MGRRANGEGTVAKRKDGLWEGKAYVLRPDGGRKRKTVYGKTRAEASEKIAELVRQARQGIVAADSSITVERYLQLWLEDVAKPSVRPSRFRAYELMVRAHLVPALGRKRLDRLSVVDVRKLLNAKAQSGLSINSVCQMHAVLRNALEQAVRDDLVVRNVARLVRVPSVTSLEVVAFDEAEARQLLEVARDDRLLAL